MTKSNKYKNTHDTRRVKDRPSKALNGRESSILAFLAQSCQNMGLGDRTKNWLDCLKNEESLDAYRLGCLIVGIEIDNPTKDESRGAEAFKNWANNLVKKQAKKTSILK